MPKCASDVWAEDRFNNHGIRAVLINGRCLFQGANGGISPCQEYDEEDYALWHALHDYQSRTWKERHAKGVPVKMTYEEWAKCLDSRSKRISGHNGVYREGIRVQCYPPGGDTKDYFATFCNFRYKPEWLEKKGKSVIPACKFAGPCTFPACGADPEEGPYACHATVKEDFDSPPIGGFKD